MTAEEAIQQHNKMCKDSCDWRALHGDCHYRDQTDGRYIYGEHRDCPDCPKDYLIEWPARTEAGTTDNKENI
jgi:hypothetical protein